MASLESELRLPREMNVKPNYSALSRKFKMDRHTIKKKMEGQRRGGLLVFQEREGRHLLLLEFQTFREEERLRGAGWGA